MNIYKVDRNDIVVAIFPNIYQCSYDEHIPTIRLELILNNIIDYYKCGFIYIYEDDWIYDDYRLSKIHWLNHYLNIGKKYNVKEN